MKHIPAWPKIRWGIDKDELGLVFRGDTRNGKARYSIERVIDWVELKMTQFPFYILRRNTMQIIRAMFSQSIDRKVL